MLLTDWAGADNNVVVLGIELLTPDETGTILLSALIDDGVCVLSDCLDVNGDRLAIIVAKPYTS